MASSALAGKAVCEKAKSVNRGHDHLFMQATGPLHEAASGRQVTHRMHVFFV